MRLLVSNNARSHIKRKSRPRGPRADGSKKDLTVEVLEWSNHTYLHRQDFNLYSVAIFPFHDRGVYTGQEHINQSGDRAKKNPEESDRKRPLPESIAGKKMDERKHLRSTPFIY